MERKFSIKRNQKDNLEGKKKKTWNVLLTIRFLNSLNPLTLYQCCQIYLNRLEEHRDRIMWVGMEIWSAELCTVRSMCFRKIEKHDRLWDETFECSNESKNFTRKHSNEYLERLETHEWELQTKLWRNIFRNMRQDKLVTWRQVLR